MNILVTGANGQLGTEIRNLADASEDKFIFTDVNSLPDVETIYLDITNVDAIRIIAESEDVDVIVNCAAYTNVDKAESDFRMADLLNNQAAANLASIARERDAVLIQISTDYVFGGDIPVPRKPYDDKKPLGVYGVTKLAGEQAIIDSGCKYLIIRTAWLYSPYGKNFVKTMKELTGKLSELKVVYDQVGSPTYAADLAALVLGIISRRQTGKTGIYHYTDEGVTSWFDFATEICRLCGHHCRVIPCLSNEFSSNVQRPHYSVLDKSDVKSAFGAEIPYWKDSLKKCIDRL